MKRRWPDFANLAFAFVVPAVCTAVADVSAYEWGAWDEFLFFFGGPVWLAVGWIESPVLMYPLWAGLRLFTLLPLFLPKKRARVSEQGVGTLVNVLTTAAIAVIGYGLMITVRQ